MEQATAVMRPPTRVLLQTVCQYLGLNPETVTRISLLPDRVVVDHIDLRTGSAWTQIREVVED